MKTFKDLSSYWVAIIGIVKVQSCTYDYSGVGFPTYGKNFMKISQYKTVQFVNILTVQVFLLTENRVESVKKYATYLNLHSTNAISNMRYLEFRSISNFFPGPCSIYDLLPYKMSRYIELGYLELFAIPNQFFGSQGKYSRYCKILRKCSSQKTIHESFFLCV